MTEPAETVGQKRELPYALILELRQIESDGLNEADEDRLFEQIPPDLDPAEAFEIGVRVFAAAETIHPGRFGEYTRRKYAASVLGWIGARSIGRDDPKTIESVTKALCDYRCYDSWAYRRVLRRAACELQA